MGFDFHRGWVQPRAGGGQRDGAGLEGRTDGDAVDTALGVEPEVVDRIGDAAVVTAAPEGRAVQLEIPTRLIRRAAPSLCLHHNRVEESDVRAIGLKTIFTVVEGQGEAD